MTGIVHRLIGHARGHGTVADHGDDIAVFLFEIARHGEAERGGNRCGGVRGTERIVFALRTLGETGQAAALAQRADTVAAPGQDLVRIALVPDIPDDLVVRRLEHMMQRRGQLDHAQTGTEMSAGDRHRVDRLGTQLVGYGFELGQAQIAQICRVVDTIEMRGARGHVLPAFQERRSRMKSTASLKTSARAPNVSR